MDNGPSWGDMGPVADMRQVLSYYQRYVAPYPDVAVEFSKKVEALPLGVFKCQGHRGPDNRPWCRGTYLYDNLMRGQVYGKVLRDCPVCGGELIGKEPVAHD